MNKNKPFFVPVSGVVKNIVVMVCLCASALLSASANAGIEYYIATKHGLFQENQEPQFRSTNDVEAGQAYCDYQQSLGTGYPCPTQDQIFPGPAGNGGTMYCRRRDFYQAGLLISCGTFQMIVRRCPDAQGGALEFDYYDPEKESCSCSYAGYEPDLDDTDGVMGCVVASEYPPENDKAKEDHGCTGENGEGNPCNVANGNKYQAETDFAQSNFTFTRSYNSANLANLGLGLGWRSNHQRKIIVEADRLVHVSGSGRAEPWVKVGGVWQGEPDSKVIVVETPEGFQLTKPNGVVERYDLSGKLLLVTDTSGRQMSYTYDSLKKLQSVVGHYGHSITFDYANIKLVSVTDSTGQVYRYEYDTKNNLIAVLFPDDTQSDTSDNPRVQYHYEDPSFPNHLTGITDESGNRYATWAYDSQGRAILSQHAPTTNVGAQERFELDFQGGQQ